MAHLRMARTSPGDCSDHVDLALKYLGEVLAALKQERDAVDVLLEGY